MDKKMFWSIENSLKESKIRERIEKYDRLAAKAREDLVKLYDKVEKENKK